MSAAYSTSGSATRTRGRTVVLSIGILASRFSRGSARRHPCYRNRGNRPQPPRVEVVDGCPSLRAGALGDGGRVGQPGERLVHVLLGELDVLELAGVVVVVGRHVEVAVAREPEQDHAALARLLRRLGLV